MQPEVQNKTLTLKIDLTTDLIIQACSQLPVEDLKIIHQYLSKEIEENEPSPANTISQPNNPLDTTSGLGIGKGTEVSTDLSEQQNFTSLARLEREYEAKLYEEMVRRVFGNTEPSIQDFQAYLNRLKQAEKTTFDEKREICKIIKFWTNNLGTQLLFKEELCRVKCIELGSKNGYFEVRTLANGSMRYSSADFPYLTLDLSMPRYRNAEALEFGKRLKMAREEKHLSTRKLAELSGMRQPTIVKYEKGKHFPFHPQIQRLAEALDVPISRLTKGISILEGRNT